MSLKVLLILAFAALCNLVTVVCLKESRGMTSPWPTLGVVVSILATQWLIAVAMAQGGQVGFALTAVVVVVMVGAGVIGWVGYAEKLSTWEIVGYAIAVGGVLLAGIAKAWAASGAPGVPGSGIPGAGM